MFRELRSVLGLLGLVIGFLAYQGPAYAQGGAQLGTLIWYLDALIRPLHRSQGRIRRPPSHGRGVGVTRTALRRRSWRIPELRS